MKTLTILTLLIVSLLCLLGCEEAPSNTPPVIDQLVAPDEVEAGTKIRLKVSTHDPDGDRLTIYWEVSNGSLNEILHEWTAPSHATTARITVYVSDNINTSVTASKKVRVVAAIANVREASRIVPGEGLIIIENGQEIESVRIGHTFEEVRSLYGSPVEWFEDIPTFSSFQTGRFSCVFTDNKISVMFIWDQQCQTGGGNGVGSSRNQVTAEFGLPDEVINDTHYYDKEGITFIYDANLKVSTLIIR